MFYNRRSERARERTAVDVDTHILLSDTKRTGHKSELHQPTTKHQLKCVTMDSATHWRQFKWIRFDSIEHQRKNEQNRVVKQTSTTNSRSKQLENCSKTEPMPSIHCAMRAHPFLHFWQLFITSPVLFIRHSNRMFAAASLLFNEVRELGRNVPQRCRMKKSGN